MANLFPSSPSALRIFVVACAAADRPLPWRRTTEGDILDRHGAKVFTPQGGSYRLGLDLADAIVDVANTLYFDGAP